MVIKKSREKGRKGPSGRREKERKETFVLTEKKLEGSIMSQEKKKESRNYVRRSEAARGRESRAGGKKRRTRLLPSKPVGIVPLAISSVFPYRSWRDPGYGKGSRDEIAAGEGKRRGKTKDSPRGRVSLEKERRKAKSIHQPKVWEGGGRNRNCWWSGGQRKRI